MGHLLAVVAASLIVVVSYGNGSAAVVDQNTVHELYVFKSRIQILYEKLSSSPCSLLAEVLLLLKSYERDLSRPDVDMDLYAEHLRIEKILYSKLLHLLRKCEAATAVTTATKSTTESPATSAAGTTTSAAGTTTSTAGTTTSAAGTTTSTAGTTTSTAGATTSAAGTTTSTAGTTTSTAGTTTSTAGTTTLKGKPTTRPGMKVGETTNSNIVSPGQSAKKPTAIQTTKLDINSTTSMPTMPTITAPTTTESATTEPTTTVPVTTEPATTEPTATEPTTTVPVTTEPTTTEPTTTVPTTTAPTTTVPTTTAPTTTEPATTAPTTTVPTTTEPTITVPTTPTKPKRHVCETATRLTEAWRQDGSGAGIKPGGPHSKQGYACDIRADLQWFRFRGDAGASMLDMCPKEKSCGALESFWTDADMPKRLKQPMVVDVYVAAAGNCKSRIGSMEVMRCSWDTDNDLIYRYLPEGAYPDTCASAFCGYSFI